MEESFRETQPPDHSNEVVDKIAADKRLLHLHDHQGAEIGDGGIGTPTGTPTDTAGRFQENRNTGADWNKTEDKGDGGHDGDDDCVTLAITTCKRINLFMGTVAGLMVRTPRSILSIPRMKQQPIHPSRPTPPTR